MTAEYTAYIVPKSRDNVWIMIAEAALPDDFGLKVIRAFSVEPTPEMVEREHNLIMELAEGDEKEVSVRVFQVGVDVFDADEVESVGC